MGNADIPEMKANWLVVTEWLLLTLLHTLLASVFDGVNLTIFRLNSNCAKKCCAAPFNHSSLLAASEAMRTTLRKSTVAHICSSVI